MADTDENRHTHRVEKVWGEEPQRLSRSLAKQRLSMSAPVRALLSARSSRMQQPTFFYPRQGMASLIDEIRNELRDLDVVAPGRVDRSEVGGLREAQVGSTSQ